MQNINIQSEAGLYFLGASVLGPKNSLFYSSELVASYPIWKPANELETE